MFYNYTKRMDELKRIITITDACVQEAALTGFIDAERDSKRFKGTNVSFTGA